MRIDRLCLQNFRKFEDASLEFHPEFNVLIGENASGKSTIIEGIKQGISLITAFLSGGLLTFYAVPNVARYTFPNGLSKETYFPVCVTLNALIDHFSLSEWSMIRKNNEDHLSTTKHLSGEELAKLRSLVSAGEPVILPLIASYGIPRAEKLASHKFDNIVESRFNPYSDALKATCNPRSFCNWLYRNFLIEVEEKQANPLLHAVRDAVKKAILECQDIRYSTRYNDVFIDTERNGQQQTVAFSDLSDGYRGMVGMIADIAHRAARLNPHLGENVVAETPGLVLIDEIDLHLHPKWQRGIVGNLRKIFPKMQFIVTTHSPLIVSEVKPESVIILKDTENGFEWCHPEESYGQTLDALIEDVFEENRHPYEVAKKFRLLFNAIENNQLDEAKQRYKALKSEICSDVDLISADIMISKKEFLEGRK